MSSITSDILRIIDCAGDDPTFTEVFARLGYATHIEVKNTLRWLERKGFIVSYYYPSMRQSRYYLSAQAEHLMDEIDGCAHK
nr:MAG TPA: TRANSCRIPTIONAL REGULATOR SLYA, TRANSCRIPTION FACTOR, GLOBAL REGULATOR.85A [Caudoviricetes sp.]